MQKIKSLQKSLKSAANQQTKEWCDNYLKHVIPFRGVKTPHVVDLVKEWITRENISELGFSEQLSIAVKLIQENHAEDKFAGILLIEKNIVEKIEFDEIFICIEKLFLEGAFNNWSTTDGLNVRVLSPLIHRHGKKAVRKFSSWADRDDIWQRRSSIVSLRACVNAPEYFPVIQKVIKQLSKSQERFIQTGIGWLIADLSKKHPIEAEKLVEKYFDKLSMEVIRRHTKYLRFHKQYIERRRRRV